MNTSQEHRKAKLALESTAFKNCRGDMSDISFEIGKSSPMLKAMGALVIFSAIFGSRFLLRRKIGNPDHSLSTIDILFWIFIIGILIFTVVCTFLLKNQPKISVVGKTLFYGENNWTSNEITCVKCSKFTETVSVHSLNNKVVSFAWERENSELFIAWAKKCGIEFEDNRIFKE